jgi:predicted nucleic acid-binding protein
VAVTIFLDTSVLLGGLIDFGPQSAPAQTIMHTVAEQRLPSAATAWTCCLEFLSLATRLQPEFRLTPGDAATLIEHEVLSRLVVHDLPAADRVALVRALATDGISGGRIYDAHIVEIARAAGAGVVVTDNRRHFLSALRHHMRVETPAEFVAGLKKAGT